MTVIFVLLTVQSLMGAFDNFWHHELEARLPQRTSARKELRLHAAREAIYGLLFASFAWLQWRGWWVLLPATLLAVELFITIADFLEEDRSRKLPPLERALHTVLAVSYGLLLGLVGPMFWAAAQHEAGVSVVTHGGWTVAFSVASVAVLLWSGRNVLAVRKLNAAHRAEQSVQAAPEPNLDVGAAARRAVSAGVNAASEMALADQLGAEGSARQLAAANPQRLGAGQSTVLVTGATGFVGQHLVKRLLREGRRVLVLTRDPLQARAALGPKVWVLDRLADVPCETRIDAVVNLAGAGILGGLWTPARRRLLLQSRLGVAEQVNTLIARLQHKPEVLVCASAVGYYGVPAHSNWLDESAPPEAGRFQSELCQRIEASAQKSERWGVRVVCLRPGIVLGADDGAFPALAFAARMGLGAVLGSGQQPMPWVHVADAVGLIAHALVEPTVQGALNAVAPDAVTQAQFARQLASVVRRPQWLTVPAWPLRLALGEMSELLLCGQRVQPAKALDTGYRFRFGNLAQALRDLTQTPITRGKRRDEGADGGLRAED